VAGEISDALALQAVRLARAECESSARVLEDRLARHGVQDPNALVVNLCAHFIALEAVLSGAMLSQMPRDGSEDDARLRLGDAVGDLPSASRLTGRVGGDERKDERDG